MNPPLFTIAIVGRPNVGKSSMFNALLGYRRSIVLDMPGTTLDLISEKVDWGTGFFRLMDTLGVNDETDSEALGTILSKADAVLFVVDALVGPTPFDRFLAREIHLAGVPVLMCVNKSEAKRSESETFFAELEFDEVLPISAAHRHNLSEVKEWCAAELAKNRPPGEAAKAAEKRMSGLDKLIESISDYPEELPDEPVVDPKANTLNIALIGKPNTGKSTLMNRLCGEEVSRVSPTPLTTRDAISFEMDTKDGLVRFVDTAGMRRPRSQKADLEVFSINASTRAIRAADIVLLMIACHEEISDQDMRLLSLIESEGKPTIVLLNFWDMLTPPQRKHFLEDSEFAHPLKQFRTVPISGLKGFNVDQVLPIAWKMAKACRKRVKTSRLNEIVDRIVKKNPPPATGNQSFNILYASQVKTEPPTFVFFVNRKQSVPASYEKFLTNQLRKHLNFKGQPIRIYFRAREKEA